MKQEFTEGRRVLVESSILREWNGETGRVVRTDGPLVTVRLDRIACSARFERSELRAYFPDGKA